MAEIKQKIIVKLLAFLIGGTSFVLQALISTNLSYAQEKKAQLQTQETQEKHTLGIGLGLEIPKGEFTILERTRSAPGENQSLLSVLLERTSRDNELLLSTTKENQLLLSALLERALERALEKRSILEPNIFALRIPLEKLTIEPFVRLGFASVSDKMSFTVGPEASGVPPLIQVSFPSWITTTTAEISASLFNIGFGGFGRYPIKKFGYSNISILAGLNFNFGSLGTDIKITETSIYQENVTKAPTSTEITDDVKISKSSFSIGLLGGAGIEYFFTKNIAVSLDLIFSVLSLVSESPKVDRKIIRTSTGEGTKIASEVPIKSEGGTPSHFFIGVENIGLRFLVFLYL
jgi:hypothetical protein